VLLASHDDTPPLRVSELAVRGATAALRIEAAGWHDGWFHSRGATHDAPWQIGDWQFNGRWLHWRTAPDGTLLRAVSHAGASLHTTAGAARLETA
jgi:hypothetical protein